MAGFFVWCWWAASTATGSTNCASNLDAKRSEALAKQVTRAPRLFVTHSAHWYQTKETLPMAGFFVWCWWAASTATGSTNCASNLDAKRSEALAKQVTRAPRLLSSFRPLVPNKETLPMAGFFVWCWWAASTATGSTNCASNLDAKRSEALAKQVTRAPRLLSSFRPLVPNK